MTVSSETNKSGPYTGNGVTTAFAYGFRILNAAHVTVVSTTAGTDTVVNPANYAVSGVGSVGGGNVTFSVAPASGVKITIIRNAPFTQTTDLENQGAYYAQTVEDALDLAAMRDQQLQEQVNRSVKIPVGENAAVLDTLIEDVIRLSDSADEIDTVAGNITAVQTVASDLNEPVSEIETVAGSIANVNTVGGAIANVNTVAGISGNVTTVAGISGNVTAVAGIAAHVATVAADISAVQTVASDLNEPVSEIETVAGSIANVNTVGGAIANVNTVAGISGKITTAADNVADITNFADVYLGPSATNPATREDGSPLQAGDLYFNTAVAAMRVYDAIAGWTTVVSSVNGTAKRQSFTATGGQTTFAITGGYDAGFIDVYLNGVKLVNGEDVTVTSGTNVVLASGATAGDSVDVVAYGTFTLANVYSKAEADALLAGKQTSDADLTALAGLATNGILARTGAGTAAARSIASGNGISVANGDGVAGNPTLSIDVASQAEAEAGTDDTKVMTPLRVFQAIKGLSINVQEFTASGTWTKPADAIYSEIMVVGGGQAGRDGVAPAMCTSGQVGSGGNAGGAALLTKAASALGATETVTIGAGGSSSGASGGTSSFGSHASATGGGATGGTGSGSGAQAITGSRGAGNNTTNTSSQAAESLGGSSVAGPGGIASGNGVRGGGGGGGVNVSSSGNGGGGYVRVVTYCAS